MAQGGGIEDWYRGLPKVTRGYMTAAMGTTVLVQLELLAPTLLFLDFEAVGTQLEVWRLMTNFVFFGGFGPFGSVFRPLPPVRFFVFFQRQSSKTK